MKETEMNQNKLYPLNMRDDDTKSITYEKKEQKKKQAQQFDMLKE